MTNHTAGPWSLSNPKNPARGYVVGPPNEYGNVPHIASFYENPDSMSAEASDANAQLIAAAPELLEALELANRELELRGITGPAKRKIEEAVNKAKGLQ